MKERVLQHSLWDHEEGDKISGDFVMMEDANFKGDTLFTKEDT